MSRYVTLGRLGGPYGVQGWVHVHSDTEPRENIFEYTAWYVRSDGEWQPVRLGQWRRHGKGLIARFEGYDQREQVAVLAGADVAVPREQLPPAAEGEYYWADLEGLSVETPDGTELGRVSHLFATGSNDVLVVRGAREYLIPLLFDQVVQKVDLEAGRLVVDWDPTF